jgi:hypothetical protein
VAIDTLLHWSIDGDRAVDKYLRERYRERSETIMSQNSLRGAMVIGGIAMANLLQRVAAVALTEFHPKLCSNTPRASI